MHGVSEGKAGSQVEAAPSGGPSRGHAQGLTPGDLAELMASFNDVTGKLEATHRQLRGEVERLRVELAEKSEQLARSSRLAALGEMAAGIAHEIRNPLGSIALYARMLVEDLAGLPGSRVTAEKIAGGVRRLDEIVGDVLAFSRELRVRESEVDAGELFDAALEACAVGGLVRVERVVEVERVVCDRGLVVQALVNLVRNAVEAMREARGGALVLTLSARRARCERSRRDAVVLGVRDTGPGVPPGVIERMFNPFFTTRETGTGLGLAIVHRIVDAHAGWIDVANHEAPCGASVAMYLPQPVRRGAVSGGDGDGRTDAIGLFDMEVAA